LSVTLPSNFKHAFSNSLDHQDDTKRKNCFRAASLALPLAYNSLHVGFQDAEAAKMWIIKHLFYLGQLAEALTAVFLLHGLNETGQRLLVIFVQLDSAAF
jgi:hypothetical protein